MTPVTELAVQGMKKEAKKGRKAVFFGLKQGFFRPEVADFEENISPFISPNQDCKLHILMIMFRARAEQARFPQQFLNFFGHRMPGGLEAGAA